MITFPLNRAKPKKVICTALHLMVVFSKTGSVKEFSWISFAQGYTWTCSWYFLIDPKILVLNMDCANRARIFKPFKGQGIDFQPGGPVLQHHFWYWPARQDSLNVYKFGLCIFGLSCMVMTRLSLDTNLVSAISIGRRLQDPLSEYVKVGD
jgi:hypothetical protein